MEEFIHTLADQRQVRIVLDEDGNEIRVFTYPAGERIGNFTFRCIEQASPLEQDEHRLINAYLEGLGGAYLRCGIGRKCLQLAMEELGWMVTVAENDGRRREDGGHQTGDAPSFIRQMREEQLIA